MKCVCGYENIPKWDKWAIEQRVGEAPDFINGDEEFIESNSTINFQLREADYNGPGDSNCSIYACPKCGTLKIEI